jgi:hypothetical protein
MMSEVPNTISLCVNQVEITICTLVLHPVREMVLTLGGYTMLDMNAYLEIRMRRRCCCEVCLGWAPVPIGMRSAM